MNNKDLRIRFLKYVEKKWEQNNHNLDDIPCIYVIAAYVFNLNGTFLRDIEYVGSTTKLKSRYKSHKIPMKIQESGKVNLLYYKPMDKGFYDYEMKLIKKLQPKYNRQHK